ncbi:MAG: DUF2142 domain-containing protein [Actinomycetales bacterium]|nr:DUF2142 domain-containing protein [Actinomycetales bacterium]
MTSQKNPVKRARLLLGIIAMVLAMLSLSAWALASPVGSSPDDDYHLTSIWCSHGTGQFPCEASSNPTHRVVAGAFRKSVCYAFQTSQSASCQGESFGFVPSETVDTNRGNFNGDYPPVYYWTVGLFAGPDMATSVVAMRIFNAALLVLLLSFVFFFSPSRFRIPLVWGLVATSIPLAFFVIPSTNPSSWAVTSIAILWVALLGYFETRGRQRVALGCASVVTAVMGAGARADAAIFVGLSVLVVVILTAKRTRAFARAALLPLGLIAVAFFFFLQASQSSAATGGLDAASTVAKSSPIVLFMANMVEVPSLWAGIFGTWGLGWLDTTMPGVVWVLSGGVFAGLIALGLSRTWRRKNLALLVVGLTLWLLPVIILVKSNAVVGSYVQPRYILPLFILLAGLVLLRKPGENLRLNSTQAIVLAAFSVLAFALALRTNMRRYINGVSNATWNLNANIGWWWDIPISPMVIWVIGTLAFAALVAVVTPGLLPDRFSLFVKSDSTSNASRISPEPNAIPLS